MWVGSIKKTNKRLIQSSLSFGVRSKTVRIAFLVCSGYIGVQQVDSIQLITQCYPTRAQKRNHQGNSNTVYVTLFTNQLGCTLCGLPNNSIFLVPGERRSMIPYISSGLWLVARTSATMTSQSNPRLSMLGLPFIPTYAERKTARMK